MVCLVRNRKKFYQKTLKDVWGRYSAYRWKIDDVSRYIYKIIRRKANLKRYLRQPFVYRVKKVIWYKIPKRLDKKFIEIRYLKNYYLILSRINFIKFRKISSKKGGFLIKNYLLLLEGRLFMILYRSNFISNLFIIKSIIDLKYFYINFKPIKWSNYNLDLGDIVTVDKNFISLLKKDLRIRIKKRIIFFYTPYYLFVNYNFMFIFFWRHPKVKEIKYPIVIDFYKGFDYF